MLSPLEVIGLGQATLRVVWDDSESQLSARELRLACVCAYCRSELTGEKILEDDKVPLDIIITRMELVGNYGLAVHFSDGHTTGIYRLRELKDRWQLGQAVAN